MNNLITYTQKTELLLNFCNLCLSDFRYNLSPISFATSMLLNYIAPNGINKVSRISTLLTNGTRNIVLRKQFELLNLFYKTYNICLSELCLKENIRQ